MTYGWLSVQTFLVVGAVIVVLVSLEDGARHRWKLELATGLEPRKYDGARPLLALFWLSVRSGLSSIDMVRTPVITAVDQELPRA